MPHFSPPTLDVVLYCAAGALLLYLGYRFGRALGSLSASKLIQAKEQELFTAQRGFKNLYEQEIAKLKEEAARHAQQAQTLTARVDEYRKKAAGLGGLFSSSSKVNDAMYALLLENEALEEALMKQNEKLKDERNDALKEQMRATGYRRVLMSQLMNDQRIKCYVQEVLSDEKQLPSPQNATAKESAA